MENISMSSERSLCADLLRAKRDREQGWSVSLLTRCWPAWSGLSRMRAEMAECGVQHDHRLRRQINVRCAGFRKQRSLILSPN